MYVRTLSDGTSLPAVRLPGQIESNYLSELLSSEPVIVGPRPAVWAPRMSGGVGSSDLLLMLEGWSWGNPLPD